MTTTRGLLTCALVSLLVFGCGDDDDGTGTGGVGGRDGGGTGGTTGGSGGGGSGGGGGTGGGAADAGLDASRADGGADDDAGDGNGNANGNGNGANGRRIEIVATEFMFTPDEITAEAGETLVITLVNMGSVDHTIEFEFDEGEATLDPEVQPGQEGELILQVPDETGEHTFYCPIDGHRALGMEGTLTIE